MISSANDGSLPPVQFKNSTSRFDWRARAHAALIHFGVCLAIAAGVLVLVYRYWYPGPLAAVCGIDTIVLILLAVDVTLGPLLTFAVFDRRKKSLPYDLAVIGVVQLAALIYGMHTVEAGRPHFEVFTVDRIELVSKADLQPEDMAKAAGNPFAVADWFGPRLVSVAKPSAEGGKERILEAVMGGRDLQHFPQKYQSYDSLKEQAVTRGRPIKSLRDLNPDAGARIDAAIERIGRPETEVFFVPVKGPRGFAAALVDARTGDLLSIEALQPWR